MVNEIDMQVQEVQRVPNKMDAERPTSRQNLKKSKRKEVSYRGVPLRLSADFSKKKLCRLEGIGKKYSK